MDKTCSFRFILLPVCDVFCCCMRSFTLTSDMTPISIWCVTHIAKMIRLFWTFNYYEQIKVKNLHGGTLKKGHKLEQGTNPLDATVELLSRTVEHCSFIRQRRDVNSFIYKYVLNFQYLNNTADKYSLTDQKSNILLAAKHCFEYVKVLWYIRISKAH